AGSTGGRRSPSRRRVLVDPALAAARLLVIESPSGAGRPAGAVLGDSFQAAVGTGGPPAGGGLAGHAEEARQVGFSESQLTAVPGAQAESFQDFIGQRTCVG